MRNVFTTVLMGLVLVMGVSTAFAQLNPPVNGTYKTQDLDFIEGRFAISWASSPAGGVDNGNVVNVQSWNGATLGTEWNIVCPVAVNAIKTQDTVDGTGTGFQTWLITYIGGTVFLDGAGPWGGGDPAYTGQITSYTEIRTILFVFGTIAALDSNHDVDADIDNYNDTCVAFAVGNTAQIGDTDSAVKPAGYPDFLDSNCAATGTWGHWGTATDLTLTVRDCQIVDTDEKSWGQVKSMYKD